MTFTNFKQEIFSLPLLSAIAIVYVFTKLVIVVRRVYFHPLSKYPGPKLAAATTWYRTYYEVWKGGRMSQHLEKLHAQYGPILRVGPNELNFCDPPAYHEIYTNNSKLTKYPFMYQAFGEDETSFGYCDPQLARRRREVLNPLFSRRNIISMQGLIDDKVDKLCEKLAEYHGTNQAVDVSSAFRCATMDIIMSFCFAKSLNALDSKGFRHPVLISVETSLPMFWVFKHFPVVKWMILNCPPWLSLILSPETAGILQIQKSLSTQLDNFLADPKRLNDTPHPIIYHRLLDTSVKGASGEVPSRKSLYEEAQALLFAGSDTVGNTLAIGTFYVLSNPDVYKRLFNELKENWPRLDEPLGYEELEKLPYLTAVIKESLRLSHGVVSPLPRVVPPSGTIIAGQKLPGGTVVSMGSPFVHLNNKIFKDSQIFLPERWLEPNAKHLDHWLVPFCRGPRQCLGINLAWCELYIGFARIFRRFDLELHETIKEDLDWREYFVPCYTGRHVQTFIKRRLE